MRGSRKKITRLLHFALCISLIILLSACGEAIYLTSETGSIAFSVEWRGAPQESSGRYAAALDCDAAGVTTVVAEVYDEFSLYLTSGGPWLCSAHTGTIQNVPVGSDRAVVVLGKDINGDVLYRGEQSGITVTAGETTDAGTIVVELFNPPFDPPVLITPTNEETVTSGSFSFTWNLMAGASQYQIQVSEDANFTSTVIDETVTTTYYTPTTTLSAGTYYWRVRAEDSHGDQSEWSEVWSFTVSTEPGVAPSTPTNVTATAGNEKVTISWNSVSGATSYNIYWATSSGVSKSNYEGKTEDITTTSYTHTGLTTGTTYYYVVTAENSYGESNESSEFSATPEEDKWVEIGAMNQTRMWHSATLLPDGKILIAGGETNVTEDDADVYDTAELYDPESGSFSFTGNMNAARGWHFPSTGPGVTLLNNGYVLITGGCNEVYNGYSIPLDSAELYNPLTGTFSYTGGMPLASLHHSAILLQDGRVLIAPLAGNRSTIYVPSTGTFSAIADRLIHSRMFHTATLLPNGKVLIAGGITGNTVLSSAELFDPATETFSETGNMNYERHHHNATLLPDGKVLITGGFRSYSDVYGSTEKLDSAEIYDPETGAFLIIGGMNYARAWHTATLLLNGKVLIAGGDDAPHITCELYDPSTGQFTVTDNMSSGRSSWNIATLLADGSVLVTGSNQRAAELYIPSAPSDSTSPSNPSVAINDGDSMTSSRNVTLTLSATDVTGVFGYYVSESSSTPLATLSSWMPIASTADYSADVPFLLSTGDSEKIVYVWFKDVAGNVSGVVSDTIILSIHSYPYTVVNTISVGDGPRGVAVTPNGSYVYVTNEGSDTVSVIRTSDNTVVDTISVGDYPIGVAVTPNGSYVYVTNAYDDTVSVIRISDNTVVNSISVGDYPNGVAITHNGSYIYVANSDDSTVSTIQTSDNTVVNTVSVGATPYGVAVTPDGGYVYVANVNGDTVSVIQTSDNTVVDTISVGDTPFGVAVTPDGSYVYVANHQDDTVSVIQTSDNMVVNTISVASNPNGVAITPNGSYVYVANLGAGTVSVIQTSDNTLEDTISVGSNPRGIAVTPDGSYVYVANSDDDTVSVIGFSE